jgi:hypothetical protein
MSIYRDNMVRLAMSFDGCTTRADPNRYVDLLSGPNDSGLREYFLDADTSGCALTVRGFWRSLGVSDDRLTRRYVFGKAVEDVVQIARERDAWVEPKQDGPLPDVGDVVYVVGGEHVWTVVDADALGYYYGIDGGQLVEGHQAIMSRARRLAWQGTALMDHAHSVRQVRGWVDCDKLFGA